jgi:hypothetical protein
MSDRDATHSDLVEIAKQNGDFRKNYGVIVGAILYLRSIKCCSASIVLVASLDDKHRSCVGLLVAMNKSTARRER